MSLDEGLGRSLTIEPGTPPKCANGWRWPSQNVTRSSGDVKHVKRFREEDSVNVGRVGPFRHDAGEYIALFTPVDLGLGAGDDVEPAVQASATRCRRSRTARPGSAAGPLRGASSPAGSGR